MADTSLEEALKDNESSFSGLLSLIPAKVYYGDGQTNPYGKKKQTKAEKATAKRARLDPDSIMNRSAKEELDARASNKRKLRQVEEEDAAVDEAESQSSQISDVDGVELEAPCEGMKGTREKPMKKKQKTDAHDGQVSLEKTEKQLVKEAKKQARKEAKKAKSADKKKRKQERAAAKAAGVQSAGGKLAKDAHAEPSRSEEPAQKPKKEQKKAKEGAKPHNEPIVTMQNSSATNAAAGSKDRDSGPKPAIETQPKADDNPTIGASKNPAEGPAQLDHPEQEAGPSNASSSSESMSPTFDAAELAPQATANGDSASITTSVASTVPPSEKPKHIKLPADTDALRERLRARIDEMRATRKAPGTAERPARSRKELMDQRRQNEAERKERKKELRRQAKLEDERKREEALAANSPLTMSPSAELDEYTANLSFGRVTFNDHKQLSHDLSYVLNRDNKKGPSDPKTALLKLQNQKKRRDGMDDEKRQDVEDKEAWLTARRRAEGEKIRDDESLLKKVIKRKERQKRKSENAWEERAQGVQKAQAAKQKKREDNLKKRQDEKLVRKLGKKGVKPKRSRPGFEGSFGGGGKKKVGGK